MGSTYQNNTYSEMRSWINQHRSGDESKYEMKQLETNLAQWCLKLDTVPVAPVVVVVATKKRSGVLLRKDLLFKKRYQQSLKFGVVSLSQEVVDGSETQANEDDEKEVLEYDNFEEDGYPSNWWY